MAAVNKYLNQQSFVGHITDFDNRFYNEFLHIIGLKSVLKNGVNQLVRKAEEERLLGSWIEATIVQLEGLKNNDLLENLHDVSINSTVQMVDVAFELVQTWVNRLLFLKMLETQLLAYHKADQAYAFLNLETIKNYKGLHTLFFEVLPKHQQERSRELRTVFENVPYLNGSLFKPTQLELDTLSINQLMDDVQLPIATAAVLKLVPDHIERGHLPTIVYLFALLKSENRSAEHSNFTMEDGALNVEFTRIQWLFDKFNGTDASSFSTAAISDKGTSIESIHNAVLQKCNTLENGQLSTKNVHSNLGIDLQDANRIINHVISNNIKLDSGQLIILQVNEIMALKSELKILQDRLGNSLQAYHITVENGDLKVTRFDGTTLIYDPNNQESQRVQEALYHEKCSIIQHCLLKHPISTSSVAMYRLRLWILLLKNSYFQSLPPSNDYASPVCYAHIPGLRADYLTQRQFEPLPNIQILQINDCESQLAMEIHHEKEDIFNLGCIS